MENIAKYALDGYEYLYHYTTADGLKSIIENRTLRFSDYRFLNDIDELVYGMNLFAQCLEEMKSNEKDENRLSYLEDWEKALQKVKDKKIDYLKPVGLAPNGAFKCIPCQSMDFHYYLLSLTTLSDDKDMWTMYSKNNHGYRIKFNGNELLKYFYKIRDQFIQTALFSSEHRSPIFYGDDKSKLYIKQYLELSMSCQNCEINQSGSIFKTLAFVKDRAFSNEKEYRLGFCSIEDMEKLKELNPDISFKKVFVNKNGILYPYLEFDKFPVEKVIEEIMISPYNKSELAYIGLKDFLIANHLENIKITYSDIKIR